MADWVSNPPPLALESEALPTVLHVHRRRKVLNIGEGGGSKVQNIGGAKGGQTYRWP